MPRFLAIDWDHNQLHVISANLSGRSVKVQHASVWQEDQATSPVDAEEQGRQLRQRLRDAGIAPAPVLFCVPRDRLIFKEVRIPPVPPEEEPTLVRFQALKELSDSPDDVVIDYVITDAPKEGGERRALALVVRKEVLNTYKKICQGAGLALVGVTPRALGIAVSLGSVAGTTALTPPPEPPDAAIAVVVVADRWAEFQVLTAGNLLLSRSLIPGNNLAAEVRRNLNVHNGQNPRQPVQAVYLTGKGVADLREQLGNHVEIPLHSFDPFAGAEVDVPPANRGGFAGAMGLLRGKATGKIRVNFSQPYQVQKPATAPNRWLRLAALPAVLCAGLVVTWGVTALANEQTRRDRLKAALPVAEERLTAAQEELKRLKALEEWDTAVWLDDLFNVNALIPDINAIHLLSVSADPELRAVRSKFVGSMTIKGQLLVKDNPRRALDEFIDRLNRDGFYSTEPPRVEKDTFTLKVHVERRPPTEHTAAMPKDEKRPAAAGGGARGGNRGAGGAGRRGGGFGPGGFPGAGMGEDE